MKRKNNSDFAIFILTHGRPDRVITYNSLKRAGYTGKLFIVIDNEDKSAERYRELYGEKVIMFDKAAIAKTFDSGDNFGDRRTIIYARNACFEIAKSLGIKYFMQLDDDYTTFQYRFDKEFKYRYKLMYCLDRVIEIMLEYYKSIPAASIAMAQGGDFIGGDGGSFAGQLKLSRKCMNTFICSTERPFKFVGRINEDVNTYTRLASTGLLMFTIPNVSIVQVQTQSNEGGMTEVYLDSGTYIKSFYTVMYQPSSVRIRLMGDKHQGLHHNIKWTNTVPLILSEDIKK